MSTSKGAVEFPRRTTSLANTGRGAPADHTMLSDIDEKAPTPYKGPWPGVPGTSGALPKKPLIDYVTNEWRTNPKYKDEYDFHPPARAQVHLESDMDLFLDQMDDCYEGLVNLVKNPRFRRKVFFIITAIACSLWMWFSVLRPHVEETQAAHMTFDKVNPTAGLYGHNRRPTFPGMVQLMTLDPSLLPIDEHSRLRRPRSRRLVFVGDIHGCKDELVTLLDKVKFNPKHDHLVTTGDMIDKGPDSLGVVDLLREMNASCVRGNHEDRVLLMREGMQDMLKLPTGLKEQSKSSKEDDAERALARALSHQQAAYLQSCPVILRVGVMSSFRGEVVVVHGGLVPGVSLENQDPSSAMTMRVIDLETHTPSQDHERSDSIPWARLWNKVQKLIPSPQSRYGKSAPLTDQSRKIVPHMTVIYGHDSKRGLQLEQWTKGLDSSCVKGGQLSALVLSDGGKQNLVQVNCRNYVKLDLPVQGDQSQKETAKIRDDEVD